MSKLTPFLPYDPEETPVSWATRLAALHTGEAVVPFLHDIGIPTGDIWVNRESAIQRLCDLTGQDLEQVRDNMVHVLAWRSYSYRGHAFSAEFLNGPETKFCPACLAEDDAQGQRPALDRKGRAIWLFRPVRTCPKHRIALMTRPDVEWHHSFREMAVRVPERGDQLATLVEAQPTRDTSPLQDYVLSRFDGQAGPEWLDGQGVEQAVRATEMVGVVIAFGTKPNLKLFTQEDWETAARAGFSFTARGEQGVRDALDLLFERFIGSGNCKTGWSGPQVVFGRLYQWLNFSKNKKDPGPIRDVVREHILGRFELKPGYKLLGTMIETRRRHSVGSLSVATGMHQKTVRNLLVAKGLISSDPARAYMDTVDATLGEKLVASKLDAVPKRHLRKMLNTTRGQCIMLLENGFIQPGDGQGEDDGNHRGFIPRQVISDFLSAITRHATVVKECREGLMDIPGAAQESRIVAEKILQAVIDGTLESTFRLADVPGYGGIRVDPVEVKRVLTSKEEEVDLSIKDIARRIGYVAPLVAALIAPREGGAPLAARQVSPQRWVVNVDDADAFARDHATLTEIAKEMGIPRMTLRDQFEKAGISPVVDPVKAKVYLYRRDQARILRPILTSIG